MSRQVEPQIGLAQAIRRLRVERNLTQETLGLEAGIHPTWISHMESGRVNPKWGKVRRIATVLEVRLSELTVLAEELEPGYGLPPSQGRVLGGSRGNTSGWPG